MLNSEQEGNESIGARNWGKPKHFAATLVTATSVGRLLASVLFGAIWTAFGYETAVTAFAVILVVALAAATPVLISMQRRGRHAY